ncbi:MAG: phage integrase N-terminal SAM-like domain-containing protein [Byssovorax sp.]
MTLLDAVRATLRRLHYSDRTEEAYLHWIREFIRFHRGRHPRDLGPSEITAFVNHLAVERQTAASTQNQAFCAVLFLYKCVLDIQVPALEGIERA